MALRSIVIDTDTTVGYNYLISQFYIENLGTTTHRDTATLIKEVLDIVAPNHTVTLAQIQALKDNMETLETLSYTLFETGSFIKTIQINNFDKYPIVLDGIKHKLYIMNSNLIFDLDLNEGKSYRVDYMIAYYRDNLGVEITETQMNTLYDLLLTYYAPHIYNEIDQTKVTDDSLTTLYYNSNYTLANLDESYALVYSCTENPNSLYSYTNIAGITELDQAEKLITLQSTPNTQLEEGQTININNLSTTIEGVTYSADGDYTVVEHTGNKIYVTESFPFSYTFPYITCTLINSQTNIQSISRTDLKITLTTTVPNTIQVGDTIYVNGTTRVEDNQTVTADGYYTVATIGTDYVTVQEQPPINYTYSSGTYPYVCKHIVLGNITSISSKVVNLDKSMSPIPTADSHVLISGNKYTVTESTNTTLTLSETIADYTPTYPQVRVNTPSEQVMVDVTTSGLSAFPTGEFMLDTFAQAVSYLQTYSATVLVPTLTNHDRVNTQVSTTTSVTGLPTMTLKGLYSKIYTGN